MKVFIAGPRAISKLNIEVLRRIDNIINNGYTILIGDANGVDKAVQKYCFEKNYDKIKVYASNGIARNNLGQWDIVNIAVEHHTKGFDFYIAKDLAMAKEANYGFMIWNGKSKGTLNNIINLIFLDKKVLVYYTPEKDFHTIKSIDNLKMLLNKNPDTKVENFFIEQLSKNTQLILPI